MELSDPLEFRYKTPLEDARDIMPLLRDYIKQNLKIDAIKYEIWYDKADIARSGKTVYSRGYLRLTLKDRGRIFHKLIDFKYEDEKFYVYTDDNYGWEHVKLPERYIEEIMRCMNAFIQIEKKELDINPSRK